MGRYDSRLQVFDGSSWRNALRTQLFNGSNWVDLGNNDSSLTRSIHRYNSAGALARVTRNKQINTWTNDDDYGYNPFYLFPSGAFCYLPEPSNDWHFSGTFMKTESGDKLLYRVKTSGAYAEIVWLADGRISFTTNYGSYTSHVHSSNAVGTWQYVWISVTSTRTTGGSNSCSINLNGKVTTGNPGNNRGAYSSGNSNQLLDYGIRFRGYITARGKGYPSGRTTRGNTSFHHTAHNGGSNHSSFGYSPKTTGSSESWV